MLYQVLQSFPYFLLQVVCVLFRSIMLYCSPARAPRTRYVYATHLGDFQFFCNLRRYACPSFLHNNRDIDLLRERTGTEPKRMWVGGGTARSRLLNQIKADVTGLDIMVPGEHSSTVRGARAMMDVALGRSHNVLDAARGLVGDPEHVLPRPEWQAHYERLVPVYKRIPELLADTYRELSAVRSRLQ